MDIEKFISQQIEGQFPSIYKEDGVELIQLVKTYYEFLEMQPTQSVYNSRRLFEYRDIDTTLDSMIDFFRKKYLSDINSGAENAKFLVKNILDLYRRKGSEEGLKLFFKMFYERDVDVYYPSKDILRPSSSKWEAGVFLQLYPANPVTYANLANKLIYGSISKAEAIVTGVQFTLINSSLTPILILNNVRGSFLPLDEILTLENDLVVKYGFVYGSLAELAEVGSSASRSGNKVGDILTLEGDTGFAGKVIVTQVSTTFTGEIEYEVLDGGFGYTEEKTRLIASDQFIFVPNVLNNFILSERIIDQANNVGTIVGQSSIGIGVKNGDGTEFSSNSSIFTLDRDVNVEIFFTDLSVKNVSSPGMTYPEAIENALDPSEAVKAEIVNTEDFLFIEDKISDFFAVLLNSVNYNAVPPALVAMSGSAPTPNLSTVINDAFAQTTFTFGSINRFVKINPGSNYLNDVFAAAKDPFIENLKLKNQILTLPISTTGFVVGTEILQGAKRGKILSKLNNTITVLPYGYHGFVEGNIQYGLSTYNVLWAERVDGSKVLGDNAFVNTLTSFAVGKVEKIKVINSGLGYVKDQPVTLRSSAGNLVATRNVILNGQGIKEGSWKTYSSHLNSENGKVLQDSFFYQDYSYEILSDIDINTYVETLKNVAHVAGIKVFGRFVFADVQEISMSATSTIT